MNTLKQYIEQNAKYGPFNTYYSFPIIIPILGKVDIDILYTEEQNLMRKNYKNDKLPYITVSEDVLTAINALISFDLSVYENISNMLFGNVESHIFGGSNYSFPGSEECHLALKEKGINTMEDLFTSEKITTWFELRNYVK